MSILIKGMEMPKDCLHCCFVSRCSYCEGYNDHCLFEPDDIKTDWDFNHGVFPGSIPDWCPLGHVSPHGRLIDADALEALFWDGQCYFTENIKYKIKNIETICPAEEGE